MILLLCLLAGADEAYLKGRAAELEAKPLAGAKTLAEWKAKLPGLRREYLDMLGLWPLPPQTPLNAKVTKTFAFEDVVIENLHFQSRPGLYVTANLYRPAKAEKRSPAILYLCGHSGKGRDGNKTAFKDHGVWFARNGYVCLVLDTLQLGEVKGVHHGTYNLDRWHWLSLGYTPAGVECWNGVRGIDYLVSRSDVDAERLGVTGISGGGATTVWVAAADERVKVAVPVSGMSDLRSYVGDKVINGHCDCMFLVNFRAWDWSTIAALIAPRPLLFANSDHDPIFPMGANRRIVARLREAYKLFDKPELIDEYVSEGGHDYRPDLRKAVFRFLNKHLKKDAAAVEDAKEVAIKGADLRAFPTDDDLPTDSINAKIDESFIRVARPRVPKADEFATWQRGMVARLREGPFFGLPTAREAGGKGVTRLVLVGDGDEEVEKAAKTAGVRTLAVKSQPRKSPNYLERGHALVGETIDRRHVERVIATVREGGGKWVVSGRGKAGVLAAYAALFEPAIEEVVAQFPPPSHRQGPHFLGVLRAVDVPTAFGLLAPRKLTIVSDDKAFDHTEALYKAAGAAAKLDR